MFYKHECPLCGSDSFRKDCESNTEVLEVGADSKWVVIDHEESENDEPNPFVYCSNCFTDVYINKHGAVDVMNDELKEAFYEN